MTSKKLKIAIIGQSTFASEVYKLIRKNGHEVVGVFTIPDQGNREDPLGKKLFFKPPVISSFSSFKTESPK